MAIASAVSEAGSTAPPRIGELVFLALSPGLAFWVMHFTPVAPPGFLDPFVYTGYINNFDDLLQRYGLTYYSVRFGLILPAQLMVSLFGPLSGYFALRYAYALVAGVPFYVLVRQRFGRPAAIATFSLLLTSPYFARAVLWDHPDASGVPFLFAAISLFLIEHRRRLILDAGAGLSAGLAIHSNVFVAAPMGIFLASYAGLWLFWRLGAGAIVRRVLVLVAGVTAVTALGAAFYWWRFAVTDIFSITIDMSLGLIGGGMATWRTPGVSWVTRAWAVLAPIFLCAMALLALSGSRVKFLDAAVWISAAAVTAFFYLVQFGLNGNSLELFYYFSYLLPFVFLLLAMIVGSLWDNAAAWTSRIGALLLLSGAIGPWVLFSLGMLAAHQMRFDQHVAFVGVAVIFILFWRLVPRYRAVTSLCATAALGVMLFSSFATTPYVGTIGNRLRQAQPELDVYRVSLQFIEHVPKSTLRPGAVGFWYSNEPAKNSMQSVQSTYLWGFSKVQGQGRGLPFLEPPEFDRLRRMGLRWLVLLAEKRGDLARGREALRQSDIEHVVVDSHILSTATYALYFELLELRPGSGSEPPR